MVNVGYVLLMKNHLEIRYAKKHTCDTIALIIVYNRKR